LFNDNGCVGVRARVRVVHGFGFNVDVQVELEDGRGFGIKTGIDHVDTPEKLREMVRFFARDLFGVEVTEVEEAE
jgi:hypothetical protein